MTVYENIDKLIKARGISRRELARMAGIKETTLAACFSRRPEHFPLKYGRAIAAVLDVDLDELYGHTAKNIMQSPEVATANAPVTRAVTGIPIEDIIPIMKRMEGRSDGFAESLAEHVTQRQFEENSDLEKALQTIDQRFGNGVGYVVARFIKAYSRLNADGRERALQTIEDMAQIERYKIPPLFERIFPPVIDNGGSNDKEE